MNVNVEPGTYIVAVSGGVDSMVLLDVLSKMSGLELIVAHFDHGVRGDSYEDRILVEQTAATLHVPFEFAEGHLGANVSEEDARKARYEYLYTVRDKYKASAIITAHHQDDLIETVFINLLRGTGRKGLSSLKSTEIIIRPLLQYSKIDILQYAKLHNLSWREDSTNQDTNYLRNYVRKFVTPKLSIEQKQNLLNNVKKIHEVNEQTDIEIANYLQLQKAEALDKKLITALDHREACEVMAGWLRLNGIADFDKKTIERLVIAAKTGAVNSMTNINKGNYLQILHTSLAISSV